MRARKELAMAELLKRVNNLESECRDVKSDMERLTKRMKYQTGAESQSEENFAVSPPTMERMQPTTKGMTHNVKCRGKAASNLPRFMRPTICSESKKGTDKQILNTSRKPPGPPKKQRPSSVYAESVTCPASDAVRQSEQCSECSISTISHLNWNYDADDGTECSRETSEYEIKEVIFPELDKLPSSLMTSLLDEGTNELENDHASKPNQQNNGDNWLQPEKKELNNSYTKWNKRVLAIPSKMKHFSLHTEEDLTDFGQEQMPCKTIKDFNEAGIAEGVHKNKEMIKGHSFTASSSSDMADYKCHGNNNSDQRDQRIKYMDKDKPEFTNREVEAGCETSTQIRTPVSKENSTFVNICRKDWVQSTSYNRDTEEICLLSTRYRRSPLMIGNITALSGSDAPLGDSTLPFANSKGEKHENGNLLTAFVVQSI